MISAIIALFRLGPRAAAKPSATIKLGKAMVISVPRMRISSAQRPPTVANVATVTPITE
jgi:hypothetical protein